ncbi:hypothetical protein MUN81_02315 [Hymenobacter sp. 5317J-9]|uniref:hypothetical protein n=1 Tax=Hymenobacter sp. 5317J-9 TaxID=2932250 RepID=UPI001FD6E1FB|nr:hypothetical protein [Hymenobacter sp. 5317J-9]UOQ98332.1 hypothetical protein MUN81_02315 [Hymenobacter sp. 5317J-9]
MPTPPLPPPTRRLVGLLLALSGVLLGIGMLLKVYVAVYMWYTSGAQNASALLLSAYLVGLLASGLLVRMGLRMRRGENNRRDPDANEML